MGFSESSLLWDNKCSAFFSHLTLTLKTQRKRKQNTNKAKFTKRIQNVKHYIQVSLPSLLTKFSK